MHIVEGSVILISERHLHDHEPQERYDIEVRAFFNSIRERGALENVYPQVIYNENSQL